MSEPEVPWWRRPPRILLWAIAFLAGALVTFAFPPPTFDGMTVGLARFFADRALARSARPTFCTDPRDFREFAASGSEAQSSWTFTYTIPRRGYEGAEVSVHIDRHGKATFSESLTMQNLERETRRYRPDACVWR